MQVPNDVAPGQPISAKDYNALLRLLRASQLSAGPGLRVQRSAVGVTVALAREQTSAPGKTTLVHPFLVSDHSGATTAVVRVRSGSVNDVVATGIEPTDQTLTSAGTWRVYLDCTLANTAAGTVTAVAVAKVAGAQPANTRTHAYITLAVVTVVAITGGFAVSEIAQQATHSLRFYPCGRDGSVDGTYNFWGY